MFDSLKNRELVTDPFQFDVSNVNCTDDILDESGKVIRWARVLETRDPVFGSSCCTCCNNGQRIMSDIEAEAALCQVNDELFERLDAYDRAIANWKKLQIVIVVLRLCHGRIDNNQQTEIKYKEEVNKKSWDDWFAKFVLDPTTRYIMLWNALMTVVYLVSIFFDFAIVGFHLRPLLEPAFTNCSTVLSVMMLIDVVLKFFQAFKANQTELVNEDNDNDEKEEILAHARHKGYVEKRLIEEQSKLSNK